MNKSLQIVLLVVIIATGLLLRTVKLSSNPPGFFADEAVIGLDAYTILHTGKDHTGHRPGFFLEALGDWRGFVPIVSAMPAVALIGLTEVATRLPSALYGTISRSEERRVGKECRL